MDILQSLPTKVSKSTFYHHQNQLFSVEERCSERPEEDSLGLTEESDDAFMEDDCYRLESCNINDVTGGDATVGAIRDEVSDVVSWSTAEVFFKFYTKDSI